MIVLYVDDDAEDIEIFIEALNDYDSSIKCLVARNGRQALDILQAELLPDFVFLDINMPVINGMTILNEIRKDKKFKDIPVVMYSTTINPREIEEYKKLGANHFMIKHNHFQDLCTALSKILETAPK
jgi:CheY-like chemotaxis protein